MKLLVTSILASLCFQADASALCNAQQNACGNVQQAGFGGTFSSPGFTNGQDYCNNLVCNYFVTAVNGLKIRVNFQTYSTEQGADFIYVYDGPKTDDAASLLASISGPFNRANQVIYSGKSYLSIRFVTDSNVQGRGFNISWTAMNSNCGQTSFRNNFGVISSPNWPNDYPNFVTCTWSITVDAGKVIQLVFNNASRTELGDDKLIISGNNGKVFTVDSGNSFPTLRSPNNFLSIRFTSDNDVVFPGFQVQYSAVIPHNNCSCGPATRYITQNGQIQHVQSPNYPRAYCENHNCTWYLNVPANFNVDLVCNKFATETGYDTMYIYNGLGTTGPILRTCTGTSCNETVSQNSQWMTLHFVSDGTVAANGFDCTFTAANR